MTISIKRVRVEALLTVNLGDSLAYGEWGLALDRRLGLIIGEQVKSLKATCAGSTLRRGERVIPTGRFMQGFFAARSLDRTRFGTDLLAVGLSVRTLALSTEQDSAPDLLAGGLSVSPVSSLIPSHNFSGSDLPLLTRNKAFPSIRFFYRSSFVKGARHHISQRDYHIELGAREKACGFCPLLLFLPPDFTIQPPVCSNEFTRFIVRSKFSRITPPSRGEVSASKLFDITPVQALPSLVAAPLPLQTPLPALNPALLLLEVDPALKRFKSYKKAVKQASKVGNVLTILAVAESQAAICGNSLPLLCFAGTKFRSVQTSLPLFSVSRDFRFCWFHRLCPTPPPTARKRFPPAVVLSALSDGHRQASHLRPRPHGPPLRYPGPCSPPLPARRLFQALEKPQINFRCRKSVPHPGVRFSSPTSYPTSSEKFLMTPESSISDAGLPNNFSDFATTLQNS
ncbi:hypothetical protein KSP40_PGU015537 [Platanthera guangdongensis]|uniref:Uncharacterized protein n=1 Tax=Platanthera guangdongensis TaxID=2320717 RepID=A0ABR2LQZ3_9ASPA